MSGGGEPLSSFHPVVRRWFERRFPSPTDIQSRAWPAIGRGENVLITAPTGSGKTLTAFLFSLTRLLSGDWESGATRVLYVSPLKALNNDVQRNLLGPLEELTKEFADADIASPEIRVLTRSGDTPQRERQRMVRKPPEVLITTPESLNLILTSVRARRILTGIRCVILDEIHAVAGTKRGTHLITALERLTLLSGEFQRIAISATVKPMNQVADLVAGFRHLGGESYEARQIHVIESPTTKELTLHVRFLGPKAEDDEESIWDALTGEFRTIIDRHTATLFFVNTRRHAEKISLYINEGLEREIAYAHHGSLAKEIRRLVEQKLKDGDLKAIVATSSLELGIDIGDLDLVVMVGSPNSVASGLQRLGRAGHRVGEVSRGYVYPLHGRDIVDAAVLTRAILDRDIEETRPITAPLDVLAQVLLGMTAVDVWDIDELFTFIRTAYPYRKLSRKQFDLVLDMLAGRYADSRIRELKPRVYIDRFQNTVKAAEGVLNLIYLSGGTIPDRGYYGLKRSGAEGTIGELDEEFVWERSLGDTFTLGAQTWTITAIGDRDVEVQPASNPINIIPFWRAEAINRDFHYCDRILRALEEWDAQLDGAADARAATAAEGDAATTEAAAAEGDAAITEAAAEALHRRLASRYGLDDAAATALIEFLLRQREATGRALPHRHHVLIERYTDPLDRQGTAHLILHTLWGGRVNRPLALLIEAAWEEEYGYAIQTFADNDSILLMLPNEADEELIEGLLTNPGLSGETRVRDLLRKKLETSGLFGGRFRENAGRALLLPRASFKQRMPLWLTRLRSKKLLSAVSRYDDFPILAETWRTCLQDEFDLPRISDLLIELQHGQISIDWCRTTVPSPFTRGLIWQKTNTYMYQGDEPSPSGPSKMGQDVLDEVLHSAALRPRIPKALIAGFEAKLRRVAPGYAPTSGDDLVQFVRDRMVVPEDEWRELVAAIERDEPEVAVLSAADSRLAMVRLPGAKLSCVVASDRAASVWLAATGRWPSDRDEAAPGDESTAGDGPTTQPHLDELLAAVRAVTPTENSDLVARVRAGAQRTSAGEEGPSAVSAYLASSGPLEPQRIAAVLGRVDQDELSDLADAGRVILDTLVEGENGEYICDVDNLESLLRLTRSAARPEFEPLPNSQLQLFLADYHRLTNRGRDPEDLDSAMEQLLGFPLPVELWESDILPARLAVYYKAWLDSLLSQSELEWVGCGERAVTFLVDAERRLFLEGRAPSDLFPSQRGSYSFWELKDATGLASGELTERLWAEAWAGRCTTDSYEPVRRGIAAGFAPDLGTPAAPRRGARDSSGRPTGGRRPHRRPSLRSWKASRPVVGRWVPLAGDAEATDLVGLEEDNKDRARQLFDRYGVLFRELVQHELPAISWSGLFRSLRVMELSGEIVAGQFFEGVRGLQFIRPDLLERLRRGFSRDTVYWLNACDPVSLCGRGVSKVDLPPRVPSNYLVFRGPELVLVARRRGRDLEFAVEPHDPRMPDYLAFFRTLASRDFAPLDRVMVETVNGEPTRDSAYAEALVAFGFIRDYKAFHLRPTFR